MKTMQWALVALLSLRAFAGTTVPTLVASGSQKLPTAAIASQSCAPALTTAVSSVLVTDTVYASFQGDPTASAGFQPGAMLSIIPYTAAGKVGFRVCNLTGNAITPGSVTLNWQVVR